MRLGICAVALLALTASAHAHCETDRYIDSDRVALLYARYLFLKSDRLWRSAGVETQEEAHQLVSSPGCCTVERVRPADANGRLWFVSIRVKAREQTIDFAARFDGCGSNVSTERLVEPAR